MFFFMKQTGKSTGKYGSLMGYLEMSGDIMVIFGWDLAFGIWLEHLVELQFCWEMSVECRVLFQHGITCDRRTELKDP